MLGSGHTRPVDLALAHTYIPGITCLVRAAFLIMSITLPSVMPSGPVLLVVATVLFLDRSIRLENIFDSNAVLCTLHASYMIQSIRQCSKPMFVAPPILFSAAQSLLIAIATVLTLDLQILPLYDGKFKRTAIILETVLLSFIIQAPCEYSATTGKSLTIQSFVFVMLSLTWTYAVGIHDMVKLLGCSSRVPTGGVLPPKSHGKFGTHMLIVQSFTPCLIRFCPLLFMDGWFQLLVSGALVCSLVIRIYTLDCHSAMLAEHSHPEYSVYTGHQMVHEAGLPVAMIHQRIIGDCTMGIKSTPMPHNSVGPNSNPLLEYNAPSTETKQPADIPDDDYSLFQAAMLNNRSGI